MQIEKNKVVTFHYVLTADGNYSEDSRNGQPVSYLHGFGAIVRGLERAMRGRTSGDTFTIDIEPEDGFGVRDPQAVQRIPLKHLAGSPAKCTPGSLVSVKTSQGQARGIVQKVGRFNVDVDFNHPMAGRRLKFEVEILDVRDASAEEIAHRHVHGPGGVQHAPSAMQP